VFSLAGRNSITSNVATNGEEQHRRVIAHFDSHAQDWKTIYQRPGLFETIHQQRRARALELIEDLGLPEATSILEAGCGAGSLAVALALRGMRVEAIDCAAAMVSQAQRLAEEANVGERLHASVGDLRDMPYPAASFDLVAALGVLPWIPPPLDSSVREIARVLKPGGHLVANVDNRWGLHSILDPFVKGKRLAGMLVRRLGLAGPAPSAYVYTCSPPCFDSVLRSAGLTKVRSFTLGFGPFSFLTREMLALESALKVHRRLQSLADDGFPGLRSFGAQYLVLARKEAV